MTRMIPDDDRASLFTQRCAPKFYAPAFTAGGRSRVRRAPQVPVDRRVGIPVGPDFTPSFSDEATAFPPTSGCRLGTLRPTSSDRPRTSRHPRGASASPVHEDR